MATSKTASFWLTEKLDLTVSGTTYQGTLDLGSIVDVGDQQAFSVEEVQFMVLREDIANGTFNYNITGAVTADATIGFQLSDLNPGTAFIELDENQLIASGSWHFDDGNNVTTMGPDLIPDQFGKLDESRMVVNDQLYFVSQINTTYAANNQLIGYVRIKGRIVKLATRDWMAIAITSTASDN